MSNTTKTPHDDRTDIEQVSDVVVNNPVQQICHWAMAHKLEGCRGCTAFRIEELGLADLISSPESDRSHRQGRTVGSRPTFASA